LPEAASTDFAVQEKHLADLQLVMARPMVAGVICSLLVLPARAGGHEVARAFRRLANMPQ